MPNQVGLQGVQPVSDPLSPTEGKELVRLCQAGRLYEVEAWIQSGKSLAVPKEVRRTPLAVAMSTGFHSLVELLLRHESSQEAKNALLQEALMFDRPAFVELALTYGADIQSVPFRDVLTTGDRALVATFLEKGADPVTGYPFAHAFHEFRVKTTLGSYLDCRRSRPELAPQLQEQLDMALRQFCQDGNLKWVSLMMWAGANPRSRGPVLDDEDRADDPEYHTTALEEACGSRNVELVKRLKPNRADNLSAMLDQAAFYLDRDVIAYLLELGANPNGRADGGSSALESCIRNLGWEVYDRITYGHATAYLAPSVRIPKTREAITLLLQHGAMWKPDPSTLNGVRRILYYVEPEVAVELIGQLLKNENGETAVQELLRVARMRQHVAGCRQQLERLGLTVDSRRPTAAGIEERPKPAPRMLRFDPQKLYEEIWSEPAEKVAARYGVSGVAIAKVCRCLRIPKPPRGYWAKKAAGHRGTPQPKLPPFEDEDAGRRHRSP
jgi:ankyrin repeat protein